MRRTLMSTLAAACLATLLAGQEARETGLLRARAMARSLERVDDHRLSVSGLAMLGRILCRHDFDTARYIFQLGAERHDRAKSQGSLTAWHELLASAAGCDPKMAVELASSVFVRSRPIKEIENEIRAALDQAEEEPRDAALRLESAVPVFRELSVPAQEEFVMALLEVRREIEERSDQLFLDAVRYLDFNPNGAAPALFVLGNYLYTSPEVLAGPRDRQSVLSPVRAGGIYFYDLTAVRPEASPDAACFYLLAVSHSITNLVSDSADHAHRYLLARQLESRAAEYSELLAALYRASIQQSREATPYEASAEVAQRTRAVAMASAMDFGSGRLFAFNAAWSARRFQEAREAAFGSQPLADLAEFGEAREFLRAGQHDTAFALNAKVNRGVKKALLYLGSASAKLQARDPAGALQIIHLAAREFEHAASRQRRWLWLARAGLEVKADSDAAFFALTEAVKAWNDWDAGARDYAISSIRDSAFGFIERVEAGAAGRQFWLNMPGPNAYAFADVLPGFTADPDRVDAIVAGIKSPERCVEAQIHALALRLRTPVSR